MDGLRGRDSAFSRAERLGYKDIVIPLLPLDGLRSKSVRAELAEICAFFTDNGYRVGYHNHAHEFTDGADHVKELLDTIPSLMFEPDIFWLAAAGKEPVKYLRAYARRLLTVHLKELNQGGKDAFNPYFGQGMSNVRGCLDIAKELGLEYVVIEFERLDVPWQEYLEKAAEFINA